MATLLKTLKTIRPWRYITAAILLLGLAYEVVSHSLYENIFLSLQETLISATYSVFNFSFVFLLLIADIGFDYQKTDKAKQPFRSFLHNIGFASVMSFLFFLWLGICCFIALFLKTGKVTFGNTLINFQLYRLEWLNASFAAIFNLVLVYLYFLFIAAIVITINSRCNKKPLGYLGLLAITLFNVIISTLISSPTGFFPKDFVSVGSALLVTPSLPLSIVIDVLYWLVLIAATGLIYHIVNKRSKGGQLL